MLSKYLAIAAIASMVLGRLALAQPAETNEEPPVYSAPCPQTFNTAPSNGTVMRISTATGTSDSWHDSHSIDLGDTVSVALQYFYSSRDAESCPPAEDVRAVFQNIGGRELKSGIPVKMVGYFQSPNLATTIGQIILTPQEDLMLVYYQTSWQKGNCSSVKCGSPLLDAGRKALTGHGLPIGDLAGGFGPNWGNRQNYTGNVVVSFISCPTGREASLSSPESFCQLAYDPKLLGFLNCRGIYNSNRFVGSTCAEIAGLSPLAKLGLLASLIVGIFTVLNVLWRCFCAPKKETPES